MSNLITVTCGNPACRRPFSQTFTPSDFAEWVVVEDNHACPKCSKEMSVEGVRLECHICGEETEFYSLSHIPLLMDNQRCWNCAGPHDVNFYSLRIAGSPSFDRPQASAIA